jgi:hypothetical protein
MHKTGAVRGRGTHCIICSPGAVMRPRCFPLASTWRAKRQAQPRR